MTMWGDRLSAILCSAVAIYMAYKGWDFPAAGDIFPKFISAAIVFISILLFMRSFSVKSVYESRSIRLDISEEFRPILLTVTMIVYVLVIFVLGYYTTTLLFLCLLSLMVGTRNLKAIAIAAGVTLPLLYAFFELFLGAQMPSGLLI
ncbi:hypothetical protein C2I36_04275 [Rhodobacteraceae bacterium WD3A24]|nr:hypothetical protein C2I36_04275 [Rhodobacteraceae bacterium WD3A24]